MLSMLIALVLASSLTPRSDADSVRALSPTEVQALCTLPVSGSDAAIAAVRAFCRWRVPSQADTEAWDLTPFRGLAHGAIDFRSGGPVITLRGAGPSISATATAPPATAASIESALLWGTADFVIARAQLQFQVWVLPRLTRRVCGRSGPLAPKHLCEVLRDTATGWATGAGGVLARLTAAARADLEALPDLFDSLLTHALGNRQTWSDSVRSGAMRVHRELMEPLTRGDAFGGALVRAVREHASSSRTDTPFADLARSLDLTAGGEFGVKTYVLNRMRADPTWTPDAQEKQALARGARIAEAFDQVHLIAASASAGQPTTDTALFAERRIAVARAAWDAAQAIVAETPAPKDEDPAAVQRLERIRRIRINVSAGNFWLALPDIVALLGDSLVLRALGMTGKDAARVAAAAAGIGLVANVAQAPSAESVRSALMTFAAPPATFLAKRPQRGAAVYLNAYLGASAGEEAVRSNHEWVNPSAAFAPYLPVGLELNVGYLGVMVQVLDLGALASWRLEGNDVSTGPEVRLAQVFSPGAYLLFRLGKWPLTLGVGAALTPQLRTVGAPNTTQTRVTARRVGAFLAFDVPLFAVRLY